MSFLIQFILPYVLLYKYIALFVITFFASIALPIPAGGLLVASAAFASQGYFNILKVIIVVIIANVLGDSVCYWLTRIFGIKILYFFGFRKMLSSKNFKIVEKRIQDKPGFIILISRFDVITSLLVNFISGVSKVSFRKFMFFEGIGAVLETTFYAMIGYLFGDSWQVVNNLIGNFSIVFFIALALFFFLFWRKIIHGFNSKKVYNDEI